VTSLIQDIMGHYTSFQSLECGAMTDVILSLEHADTGRVPLAKFYEAGLAHKWKFWEPKAYLQHAGALDESDATRPAVIIPNYVYGMNNCLASSSFFSVCCTNKCEHLIGHLERTLEAPSAAPERIAALVAELPSDTVEPRALPSALTSRLLEIAAHHGGEVPLHGRLFSQWLHHAYPRECPFPHVDGEENPLTPEAWAEAFDTHFSASDEDMRRHMREYRLEHGHGEELPWSSAEQLVATHRRGQAPRPWWQKCLALVAVVAVAVPILRTWESVLGMRDPSEAKHCKHLV